MRKQLMVLSIIIILLSVGLNGCEENSSKLDADRIIGTWVGSDIFQNSTRNITMILNQILINQKVIIFFLIILTH